MRQLFFGFEGRIGRAPSGPSRFRCSSCSGSTPCASIRCSPAGFPYSVFEGLTVALVLAAPLIWVQTAIVIKRCHDRGKSGFWALLLFIPVFGLLWLLIDCGLLPPAEEA